MLTGSAPSRYSIIVLPVSRNRELLLETPAEIRAARKDLFDLTVGVESNGSPESRGVRVLLLDDQPDEATLL
jgi:hypothetical protein